MICTEQEARKKWCPMVRCLPQPWNFLRFIFCGHTIFTTNRGNTPAGPNCIASACVLWRWEEGEQSGIGYCGLGGKP